MRVCVCANNQNKAKSKQWFCKTACPAVVIPGYRSRPQGSLMKTGRAGPLPNLTTVSCMSKSKVTGCGLWADMKTDKHTDKLTDHRHHHHYYYRECSYHHHHYY